MGGGSEWGTHAKITSCTWLWFSLQVSGFRFQGSEFKVQGLGFRVQGLGFRVQGLCGSVSPEPHRKEYIVARCCVIKACFQPQQRWRLACIVAPPPSPRRVARCDPTPAPCRDLYGKRCGPCTSCEEPKIFFYYRIASLIRRRIKLGP